MMLNDELDEVIRQMRTEDLLLQMAEIGICLSCEQIECECTPCDICGDTRQERGAGGWLICSGCGVN